MTLTNKLTKASPDVVRTIAMGPNLLLVFDANSFEFFWLIGQAAMLWLVVLEMPKTTGVSDVLSRYRSIFQSNSQSSEDLVEALQSLVDARLVRVHV